MNYVLKYTGKHNLTATELSVERDKFGRTKEGEVVVLAPDWTLEAIGPIRNGVTTYVVSPGLHPLGLVALALWTVAVFAAGVALNAL